MSHWHGGSRHEPLAWGGAGMSHWHGCMRGLSHSAHHAAGGFPLGLDAASQARARAGLPFAAHCCWNGLAVLRAEPLYRGLAFRWAPGLASEDGWGSLLVSQRV
jgi:hypothetical protein